MSYIKKTSIIAFYKIWQYYVVFLTYTLFGYILWRMIYLNVLLRIRRIYTRYLSQIIKMTICALYNMCQDCVPCVTYAIFRYIQYHRIVLNELLRVTSTFMQNMSINAKKLNNCVISNISILRYMPCLRIIWVYSVTHNWIKCTITRKKHIYAISFANRKNVHMRFVWNMSILRNCRRYAKCGYIL